MGCPYIHSLPSKTQLPPRGQRLVVFLFSSFRSIFRNRMRKPSSTVLWKECFAKCLWTVVASLEVGLVYACAMGLNAYSTHTQTPNWCRAVYIYGIWKITLQKIKRKLILFLHFRIKIYVFPKFRIVQSLLELLLALPVWYSGTCWGLNNLSRSVSFFSLISLTRLFGIKKAGD